MNIYKSIRELAKTNKWQNLFSASKDLNNIRLFRNDIDFSKLQELFLNYLYIYDMVTKDILMGEIMEFVLNDDIYIDSYLLWRKENKYKNEKTDNKQKPTNRRLHLVPGKKIIFPKEAKSK